MNFWEKYYNLCLEKGTSPSVVATELGISTGTVSWWKKGKVPYPATAQKIADYFGVSVSYLLNGEEKEKALNENNLTEDERLMLEKFRGYSQEKRAALLNLLDQD